MSDRWSTNSECGEGIPRSAEQWLLAHPHVAYELLNTDAPFTARDALANTEYSARKIQKLIRHGIVEHVARETTRRDEYDGNGIDIVGHHYRVNRDVARFIDTQVKDTRERDGWCEDPSCGRQVIRHGSDGPRCACGSPVRGESDE